MSEPIQSLQNPRVKLVYALQTRSKTRRKEGKIVLEGVRLLDDAWANGYLPEFVFHTEDADAPLLETFAAEGVPVLSISREVMQHLSDTQSPQGLMGVYPLPVHTLPNHAERVVILDGIGDPGNLGTIVRTAAGAGVDAVILAPDCVDPYNPKSLRSGMGAHFRIPLVTLDWAQIGQLPLSAFYLAAADASTPYDQVDWQGAWGLIIGSEAHGASESARALATQPLSIPMQRDTESLNAAIAAAVLLFEAARQRRNRAP